MQNSLRGFFAAVLVLWVVLCIAAWLYSQDKSIPVWVTAAVVPAFLVEAVFYVAAGTKAVRLRLEAVPKIALASAMAVTAIVPYIIYSAGTGVFRWTSLAAVLLLASISSFWYVLFGRSGWTDAGYLVVLAAPILFKAFPAIYIDPIPKLQTFILGALMWYRTAIISILVQRRLEGVGFGFIPRRSDWKIGIRNYLYFIPVAVVLGLTLHFIRIRPDPLDTRQILLAIVTFVAVLWVLALAEEFFFRGFLQQLLTRGFQSELLGLLAASVAFGAAHLGFGRFPNWPFALLATLAGIFYGRAYIQGRSIRAAMVTHAMVVTTWRVFFLV